MIHLCFGLKWNSGGGVFLFLKLTGVFGNTLTQLFFALLADVDLFFPFTRCFPHIVHLACQAILKAITDTDFADDNVVNFEPRGRPATTFMDAIDRDPIATLRAIVRQVVIFFCLIGNLSSVFLFIRFGRDSSSLRRHFFSDVLKALKLKDLELLRDVITRWSSTLLMIDCGLLLRPVSQIFHDGLTA
jgi:hypothetical protein